LRVYSTTNKIKQEIATATSKKPAIFSTLLSVFITEATMGNRTDTINMKINAIPMFLFFLCGLFTKLCESINIFLRIRSSVFIIVRQLALSVQRLNIAGSFNREQTNECHVFKSLVKNFAEFLYKIMI
jgi:hypothetical protein